VITKIYLVEDCANAPGRILGCFRYESDAKKFAEDQPEPASVEERTLYYKVPVTGGCYP